MGDQQERISPFELARGVIQSIPSTPRALKGVWYLATARPHKRLTIARLIERHAAERGTHPAILHDKGSYTYAEFNGWSNRYAHALRDAGIGRGDVVALMVENRPELLAAVVATFKLGAVAGMINTHQRGEVLTHSLGLIEPAAFVVGDELVAACDEVVPDVSRLVNDRLFWIADGTGAPPNGYRSLADEAAEASDRDPLSTGEVEMQDPCLYIFTSGTTGMPKASVLSHRRFIMAMSGFGYAALRLRPDDVFYTALPLYHNNALTISWGSAMGVGATFAVARRFSVSRFWDDIRRYDATVFSYIGELCRYLLTAPPSSDDRRHRVRAVIGNGLRPEIWEEFQQRFGIPEIRELYAASEGNSAFLNLFNVSMTAGFGLYPYAIVEYDPDHDEPVRGEDGKLQRVGAGGTGLLLTKVTSRTPYEGYTDPAASERKLVRDAFRTGDVWFNTGDLVHDQGFRHIAFVDRVGDTFRWKGENVATTEVEAALNASPQIEQAVAYGVQVPGFDGRAGMAAITLADGVSELDGGALAADLRARLPAYAVPVFLRLRPAHDTTGTFKYKKSELREQAFRPAGDVVLVLWPDEDGYVPLTDERLKDLDNHTARI